MVINKPAGLLSVPGKGEALYDSVQTRLVALEPKTLLIHRLDRDTSGILIFALSRLGQNRISRQFQERQTHKIYEALVAGHVKEESGVIDIPVIYDETRPPLHIVDQHHKKPAITHWKVLNRFEMNGHPVTRLELTPITGRAHQLRVHLQYLGHPIVGDTLYASAEQQLLNRLCLHAHKLSLFHPKTEQALHFESPVPF